MSYPAYSNRRRKNPGARALSRVATLAVLASTLAACADEPTAVTAVRMPTSAALGKGAKDATPAIAFTRNTGPYGGSIFTVNEDGTRLSQVTVGETDRQPAWSPDHRRLAIVRDGQSESLIYIRSANGAHEVLVGPGQQPTWSPDGTRLAFTRNVNGNQDIYSVNLDGTGIVRLTTDPAIDREPHWSPDNDHVAFESNRSGTWEIYSVDHNGQDFLQETFCGPNYYCIQPKWSPLWYDSRILYYIGTNPGTGATPISAIQVIQRVGDEVTTILNVPPVLAEPTWSPDAQRVAFVSRLDGQSYSDLYTMKADGTGVTRVTISLDASVTSPAWSR